MNRVSVVVIMVAGQRIVMLFLGLRIDPGVGRVSGGSTGRRTSAGRIVASVDIYYSLYALFVRCRLCIDKSPHRFARHRSNGEGSQPGLRVCGNKRGLG